MPTARRARGGEFPAARAVAEARAGQDPLWGAAGAGGDADEEDPPGVRAGT